MYSCYYGSSSLSGSLSASDLDTLMEEISTVCGKWENIGRQFGMEEEYLTEIHTSHSTSHDRLKEMLSRRLNNMAGRHIVFEYAVTWGGVIVALRRANEPQVADNLKAKYIPGELTITSSSQYSLESQNEECILLYCD